MKTSQKIITRRQFLKQISVGVAAAGSLGTSTLFANPSSSQMRVSVMSDLHIGRIADGLDGAEWFARALTDIKNNAGPIRYALTLGDITQSGDRASLIKYLALRNRSSIQQWFELAGNHDHYKNGIGNYITLIRGTEPHHFIDGNIAWFFISDEKHSGRGDITDKSYQWLKKKIALHKDKVLIVCSHQLPPDTIYNSDKEARCLHPNEKVEEILSSNPIDLWLCGHEHMLPYTRANIARKGATTFINVASMSHAYETKASGSFILEFRKDAREIVARRRNHDSRSYSEQFEVKIPVRSAIHFS